MNKIAVEIRPQFSTPSPPVEEHPGKTVVEHPTVSSTPAINHRSTFSAHPRRGRTAVAGVECSQDHLTACAGLAVPVVLSAPDNTATNGTGAA